MEDDPGFLKWSFNLIMYPWDGSLSLLGSSAVAVVTLSSFLSLGLLALLSKAFLHSLSTGRVWYKIVLFVAMFFFAYIATGSTIITTVTHQVSVFNLLSPNAKYVDDSYQYAILAGLLVSLLALVTVLVFDRPKSFRQLPHWVLFDLEYRSRIIFNCLSRGVVLFWITCVPIHALFYFLVPDLRA